MKDEKEGKVEKEEKKENGLMKEKGENEETIGWMEAAWEDGLEEEAEQKECWVVKWLV